MRVSEFLLREYRRHRMARFGVWVLAYGLALWLVDRFSAGAPDSLWSLFWLASIPVAAYYLFRLLRLLRRHILWHLRRRLILTYFFVGVVPIGLILLLVLTATFILNGQIASFLVLSRLRDRAAQLGRLAAVLARHGERFSKPTPTATIDDLERFLSADLAGQYKDYPNLEVTFQLGPVSRAFQAESSHPVKALSAPPWLKSDKFSGIVLDGNQLSLRAIERANTPNGSLLVILSHPFTPQLLDEIGEGIGPVSALSPKGEPPGQPAVAPKRGARSGVTGIGEHPAKRKIVITTPSNPNGEVQTISSDSLQMPPSAGQFDFTVYNIASLQPYIWQSDTEQTDAGLGLFYVSTRLYALNRQLLSTLGQVSGFYWTAFAIVGVVFLVIELVALVISWRLTRSITTTIDKLNVATERVKAGDFTHRINLPARDQLTALGEAFDGMTASVERLLKESLEKTRLEGELEIAREVQNRLFPQSAPEVAGLRLYGLCKPARTVSGDYYDFLRLSEGNVALVVGDISGKGISAALLMATLQSALHAQFYDGQPSSGLPLACPAATAEVVSRLNRQIYASTPREKYVTMFYGVYDSVNGKLTYTNAGHLPPALFRQNRIMRLEGGGTVVGLFPAVRYEQTEVQIEPGDLLLAFTDGMTEPENSFGEEFGEERLLQVAKRALSAPPEVLMDEIYRTVSDWTGSPELQDDMTLVVAQAEALSSGFTTGPRR
jgi:phosphoserine phosphatase RsbU/P